MRKRRKANPIGFVFSERTGIFTPLLDGELILIFMQTKNVVVVLGVLVIVGIGFLLFKENGVVPPQTATSDDPAINLPVGSAMPVLGGETPEVVVVEETPDYIDPALDLPVGANTPATGSASSVKEFTMTAYFDEKGKWFSLKEMTVKKGDNVRLTITNTKGMHNFNIDELGIKKELPLNTPVVVEFTADKAGEFVYYCAMPGHRAGGQWGTLRVTE